MMAALALGGGAECVWPGLTARCLPQFFANRFHFDPETHLALTTSDPGYSTAHVPRTTFDNLLWSLVTVFQVLTAENWNQVCVPTKL